MVCRAAEIPPSWEITSDSLAAWLAGFLRVRRILVVKRIDAGAGPISAESLAASGIVDAAFPRFLAASGAAGFLLGPGDRVGLGEALRADTAIGRPIGLVAAHRAVHHRARTQQRRDPDRRSFDGKSRT